MLDPSWIQTYTGRKFYPFDPDPEEICIEDIAHSLAMQCRYNGHTKQFYSVAQHSVLLSQKFFSSLDMRLAGLLHDASEAYLSDVPRPIKHRPEFRFYREAEERLQRIIIRKFGVELNEAAWRLIKTYDSEMLAIEAPQLAAFEAECDEAIDAVEHAKATARAKRRAVEVERDKTRTLAPPAEVAKFKRAR